MTARRVKTYSAESGYVYQYSFQHSRRARRGLLAAGTEYVFEVSSDRKQDFLLAVFVRDDALHAWAREHGRELSSAESYASAKMRLFRAFDTAGSPEAVPQRVVVDSANIGELLAGLGIGIG